MSDQDSYCKESANEKPCWQEASEKLHAEYPRLYAQLEETLATKARSLSSAELSSQIVKSIAESKRQMLDREVPSNWKHRDESEKAKFRTAMDHVLKAVTVFRDMGSAVAQVDPSHVGIAWVGVNLILQVCLADWRVVPEIAKNTTAGAEWDRAKCRCHARPGSNFAHYHEIRENRRDLYRSVTSEP